MKIVDTRGQPCPAPLIATKRALKEAVNGESFGLLTDSQTSLSNILRFLKDNKAGFKVEDSDGFWTITVSGMTPLTHPEAGEYCPKAIPHFARGNFVIAFSSDSMGDGDKEIGHVLMANFLKAIKDLDVLPDKMLFYNKGVTLGSDDSPVVGEIREIEKMGVGVFFCSTCVRYYAIEEKVKVGSLSNMFEIVQIMATASNVIKP